MNSPQRSEDGSGYAVQMSGSITVEDIYEALSDIDESTKLRSFQIEFVVDEETPVTLIPPGIDVVESGFDEGEATPEGVEEEGSSAGEQANLIKIDELPETPAIEDIDVDNIEQYEYRALQRVASNEGVKGNLKKEEMIKELRAVEDKMEAEADEEAVSESDTEEELTSENLEDREYQELQKLAANHGVKGNQKREVLIEEIRSEVEDGSEEQEAQVGSITIRPGHAPFYVMQVLDSRDEWTLMEHIKVGLNSKWDVNEDSLNTYVWQLSEHGLLEKRPYEGDKRKKEYRLTEEGQNVIENAIQFAKEEGRTEEILT